MAAQFTKNVLTIYGGKGQVWLERLPSLIKALETKWGLSKLNPLENLSYNYVLKGFQNSNPIILKIGLDIMALEREAMALKTFGEKGCVRLLECDSGMLLLEKINPGTSLKQGFPHKERESIQIATDVMKKLHSASPPHFHSFSTIEDWLIALDQGWNIPSHHLQKSSIAQNISISGTINPPWSETLRGCYGFTLFFATFLSNSRYIKVKVSDCLASLQIYILYVTIR